MTAKEMTALLNKHGIKGQIKNVQKGLWVTRYKFLPEGSARISALVKQIAKVVGDWRIAVVPQTQFIGIEISNYKRPKFDIKKLLSTPEFKKAKAFLPIALGQDVVGKPVIRELVEVPHILVAGRKGSGKTNFLNSIVMSLTNRLKPAQLQIVSVSDIKLLEKVSRTLDERLKLMKSHRNEISRLVRHMALNTAGKFPYLVVLVDELSSLVEKDKKAVTARLQNIAQKGRSVGIHLIVATERPDAKIIPGTIKANFPTRVAFKMDSAKDSRTILGEPGAETLLPYGDMLFSEAGCQPIRVHAASVSKKEIDNVLKPKARR